MPEFLPFIPLIIPFFDDDDNGGSGSRETNNVLNRVLDVVTDIADDLDFDIENVLDNILEGVGGLPDEVEDIINQGLDSRLGDVDLSFSSFLEGLGGDIGDLLGGANDIFNDVSDSIEDAVEGSLDTVTEFSGNLLDKITQLLDDLTRRAIELITNAINKLVGPILDLINRGIELFREVAERVIAKIVDFFEPLIERVKGLIDKIGDFLGDVTDKIDELLGNVGDTLRGIGEEILSVGQEVFDRITGKFEELSDQLFEGAESALGSLQAALESRAVQMTRLLDNLPDVLQERIGDPVSDAFSGIPTSINSFILEQLEGAQEGVESAFEQILVGAGISPEVARRMGNTLFEVFPANPIMAVFVFLFALFGVVQGVSQIPGQMIGQRFGQEIAEQFPISLPSAGDLQQQTLLGLQNDENAITLLQRQGFSRGESERLLGQRRQLPDIGIIQVWFLREFIDRETALDLLQRLGLTSNDSQRMLRMAFFIPPVQDLITMAVREVFTPEIAERFGQFEDFPDAFADFASQQGISNEWARNYWAAHWALPSLQMGFQMLQRGVIDESELNVLLRSQDVMPFWRDKLTQISFSPLTRVDIRRMHGLGLLDEDELVERYMAVGFSAADAELMREFTLAFNAPDEPLDPDDITQLTRSTVLNLFSDGTINEGTALALLKEIGFSDATAAIFVEATRLDQERDDRKAQTDLILDQAQAGILTFVEAQDKLGQLGLEPIELQRAVTTLERRRAAATRLPTKSQLDQMLAAGLIDKSEYLITLERLGFAPFWAERFLSLAMG